MTPAAATGAGHYGASADYQILYRQCGITAAAVAAVARDSIRDAQNGTGQEATGTFAPPAGGTAGRPA